MSELRIDYSDLAKLKSLQDKIRLEVINKAMKVSLEKTPREVSEFAYRQLEKSGLVKFDRKVQKNRIKLGGVYEGREIHEYYSYIRFSGINESLSSFPYKFVRTTGTDGKNYLGFRTRVLGRVIEPLAKTFISRKKHWSLKRIEMTSMPLRKAYVPKSSISDILRFDKSMLEKIETKAINKFGSEVRRNLKWNLYKLQR